MLLSPILFGLSNLFSTITQVFKKFFVYALAPVLYNIGILVGVLFLYPLWGLTGLAFGVILGAFLHMIIQLPVVVRHGFFPTFSFNIDWKSIWSMIRLSLPRTLGLSFHSFVFIVLIALASNISEGSVSILRFSFNLQSVPLALIGLSYSVAAFPILAEICFYGKYYSTIRLHFTCSVSYDASCLYVE